MSRHGTASSSSEPAELGVYIEFQTAILRALPRDISHSAALGWASKGEALMRTLRQALLRPSADPPFALPVWMTLRIGDTSAEQYRQLLKPPAFGLDYYAQVLLRGSIFSDMAQREGCVDLILVTPTKLGFDDGATYQELRSRAYANGLFSCPAPVGPALRIAWLDQPNGNVIIGMEPLVFEHECYVFDLVANAGGKWLRTYYAEKDRWVAASEQVVFMRPR